MGISSKNKMVISYKSDFIIAGIVVGIVVLTVVTFVIYLFHESSQADSQAEKTNEAKKLMAPIDVYAQSQRWKSVSVYNNPATGDNDIPTYGEEFLTTQARKVVEEELLTFLSEKGYQMDSQRPSPSQDVYLSKAIDLSEININGASVNGNTVDVKIDTASYDNGEGSYEIVPPGKTAVYVGFNYYGYVNQTQNGPTPTSK